MTNEEIVKELDKWLGEKGKEHFRKIKEKHGSVMTVWNEGGIPHATHFREGMQVRNKLREITDYSKTDHWYDDNWVRLVELCLV